MVIKTILVPVQGGVTDAPVFRTALAAAEPFGAHLHFVYVHVSPGEAVRHVPGADFALGQGLTAAVEDMRQAIEIRDAAASRHFEDFCAHQHIAVAEPGGASDRVTASFHREKSDPVQALTAGARQSDLIVMGRASGLGGFPSDLVEQLVLGSGGPVLLAPSAPPQRLIGTALVCWRDSPEAARALTAALPFLLKAKRVVIASVTADRGASAAGLAGVARRLAGHGISAETWAVEPAIHASTADELMSLAQELEADLVVAGAYGHSRLRELVFGGVTRSVLEDARRPVLLAH